MTKNELKLIFNQKKFKIVRTTNKKGVTKVKSNNGFNSITFDEFYNNWFNKETFEKGCFYCGTTNEVSQKLYAIQRNGFRHDATRGGKRGRRLELDRINPNLSYDVLENIVWCCYWCNNGKCFWVKYCST